MAQAEPFEPDLGHASEGTGRQFCQHYRHCLFTHLHARISLNKWRSCDRSAFSQGLYGRLRQLAAADWQRYVAHPFVQQLASGTLAENAFRRYLIGIICF